MYEPFYICYTSFKQADNKNRPVGIFIVRKDKPFQIITKEKVFKCKANVPFTLEKYGF
jgi:hypothetical protein